MRVLFAALICSGAILGQAAIAQTQNAAAPSDSAQPVAPAVPTAAPSPAATAAAATAPASVPEQSAGMGVNLDEIVCKNEPATTGSRLGGGRECHTVREWNQRQKEAQDITRMQERTGLATPGK